MADRQTGRSSDQFNLRFPEGMRERIAERAAESGRSMNSEIIDRLASTLENRLESINLLKQQNLKLEIEIATAEGDLREQANTIEEYTKAMAELRKLLDDEADFQRRLMFHVLNYYDQIPQELALWAHNMTLTLDRQEAEMPDDAARRRIIERRDRYNEQQFERLRAAAEKRRAETARKLAENDSQIDNSDS